MARFSPDSGFGTLVTHVEEGPNPHSAHITPIYQTTTFSFPDVATGAAIFSGEQKGYYYTRCNNPNQEQLARKIAYLEAWDLLQAQPESDLDSLVAGQAFASGMAAVSSAILAKVSAGATIIVQRSIYSNTFTFLNEIASRLGVQVIWVDYPSPEAWQAAFYAYPDAVLAYAETPVNPAMAIVDLEEVAKIVHASGSWLMVDNTYATPFCQRPLSLGADVVIHSTTKYLSGHGLIIGGALVSRHLDYVRKDVNFHMRMLGGSPSPFDAWMANIGLKTLELRMLRHCDNALQVARFLETRPEIERVYYPGLESNPGYEIARKQMHHFGGMVSFELKGGLEAGKKLMNGLRLITMATSFGTVDSLIQHPASMSHAIVPTDERRKQGISDGLVRFSVGIENIEDILADLSQALEHV